MVPPTNFLERSAVDIKGAEIQVRCGWSVNLKTEQHTCNTLGRLWYLYNSKAAFVELHLLRLDLVKIIRMKMERKKLDYL